jgi:hypothetical protein
MIVTDTDRIWWMLPDNTSGSWKTLNRKGEGSVTPSVSVLESFAAVLYVKAF